MLINRGDFCHVFGEQFDAKTPTIRMVGRAPNAYLWIGGVAGPCYATLSDQKKLRKLAQRILQAVGEKP